MSCTNSIGSGHWFINLDVGLYRFAYLYYPRTFYYMCLFDYGFPSEHSASTGKTCVKKIILSRANILRREYCVNCTDAAKIIVFTFPNQMDVYNLTHIRVYM